MKILKNAVLTLALALGALSFANAQMMRAGIHVTPSLPMGDFSDQPAFDFTDINTFYPLGAGFGIGGNLFANFYPNENFHIGLEAGFRTYSFDLDSLEGLVDKRGGSVNIIPIQATAAYHTDAEGELDIYFGTGVGLFLVSRSFDDPDIDAEGGLYSGSEAMIGFSPRVGLSYELADNLRLDGNVNFTYVLGNEEGTLDPNTFDLKLTGYPDLMMINVNLGIAFLLFD